MKPVLPKQLASVLPHFLLLVLSSFLALLPAADTAVATSAASCQQPNALVDSNSPYLLQHACNPVNWQPWGEAAFARAKKENKPIFLSIGYSTCYWCHVMARESFENEEIAAIINRHFIAIKVDREERPDIDAVYMAATEVINGHGGWPMSVFLDHRLRPFHAATYYPPYTSERGPGLKDILLKIRQLWEQQRDTLEQNAEKVTQVIAAYADDTAGHSAEDDAVPTGRLKAGIVARALAEIRSRYESEFGGFSHAPKFPRPGIFLLLARLAASGADAGLSRDEREEAAGMLRTTLHAMAYGGIFDQVGGGFHRYAVDDAWQVPHFEKMLYTQALMVMVCSEFYRIEADRDFHRVVLQTIDFVQREMRSPEGGYYAALDAESERPAPVAKQQATEKTDAMAAREERAEGALYLWSLAELKTLLARDELAFAKAYFHLREQGNIYSDPNGDFAGLNILYVDEEYRGESLTARQEKWLATIRARLLQQRAKRPQPHIDDKMITAWNAMMVTALVKASQVFGQKSWLRQAEAGLDFISRHLQQAGTGRLWRHYRQVGGGKGRASGMASGEAMLEDYAWLIQAQLAMYRAAGERRWLDRAVKLQTLQDSLFLDDSSGAYFGASASDAALLFRFRNIYDDALPAANAISLDNLLQLAELSPPAAAKAYRRQAARLLGSFAAAIERQPSAAATALAACLRSQQQFDCL